MTHSEIELSEQAEQLRVRAHARRIRNEVQSVQRDAEQSGGRIELSGVLMAGECIVGLDVRYHVRTVVSPTPGVAPNESDVPQKATVRARFTLESYPAAPPTIGLLSEQPLFLPAVAGPPLPVIEGKYPAFVCTHRDFDPREHDLPFFVRQVARALICDAATLNSANDALNPVAAQWVLARRQRLSLPFEPDLLASTAPSPVGSRFRLRRAASR